MPTIDTAATTACAFVALYAGHMLGDHPLQPSKVAAAKGTPTDDRLAAGTHPWTGWSSCVRHVAVYTATQAAALLVIALVAPLTTAGAAAALAASASTHAVIDRRWIVRAIIRAKGCQDWPDGPYLIDQSLHVGVLLVAAVLAAAVTSTAGAAAVLVAAGAVLAAALVIERHRGKFAATRAGDPFRL